MTLIEGSSVPNNIVICGFEGDPVAADVAKEMGIPLTVIKRGLFNDTSSNVRVLVGSDSMHALENKEVHLIAGNNRTSDQSIDQTTMQVYLAIDAIRQAGGKVKLYLPHLGYARQDKVSQPGEPLAAQAVLRIFELAGADKITVLDIHNKDVFAALRADKVNKFAMQLFANRLKEMESSGVDLSNVVVVAPDKGARDRARIFQEAMKTAGIANVAFAYFDKSRDMATKGQVQTMDLREYHQADGAVLENGEAAAAFEGKTAIVVDDMADTCGTMLRAISDNIVGRYHAKEAYAVITHGVFSKDALDKIARTKELAKILVTDSIPLREDAPANLEVVSSAPVFVDAIRANITA